MEMDEDTGLPKLPDDLVWEVEKEKTVLYKGLTLIDSNMQGLNLYRVNLLKKYPDRTKTTPSKTTRTGWWNTIVEPEKKEIIPGNYSNLVYTNLYEVRDTIPHNDKVGWTSHTFPSILGKAMYVYVRSKPLNDATIREAAIRTWEFYLEDQHVQALKINTERELNKFVGLYPPKRIGK